MSSITERYRALNRMKEPILQGNMNFIDLVEFMNRNHICFQPGCTTCYCMGYRSFLKDLGDEGIASMMNSVKREEVIAQYNLDWHDAMEVLLVDNSPAMFKDSFINKAYNYVWDEYRRLRYREHLKPWGARQAIKEELKSFMG